MTCVVAMLAAAVLLGLGALHAYWAGGGRWGTDVTIPKRGGQPLFVPGLAGTMMVAVLLWAAGLVFLGRAGLWGQRLPRAGHLWLAHGRWS